MSAASILTSDLDDVKKRSEQNPQNMYVVYVADQSEDNGSALGGYFNNTIVKEEETVSYLTINKRFYR
jgi:hypothetical protein